MKERILIIHGYSDCSESFAAIKQFLIANGEGDVDTVLYADYESREDSLTFNDTADGLNDALLDMGILEEDGSSKDRLKVLVHSTGSLVIRHWIWRYYQSCGMIDKCPVTAIVMLAPANFGSPLAHRGKSFLGSLVKGRWKVGDFLEVGKNILDGLELASAFQWQLTHRDLLIDNSYFKEDKIRVTVLVGDKDYQGWRGWVNKPGTDGTVVISGTNLDAVKLTLELGRPSRGRQSLMKWTGAKNACTIAFGVLHDADHGTIVDRAIEQRPDGTGIGDLILRGLKTTKDDFCTFKDDLTAITELSYQQSGLPRFQQFLIHVVDDYGLSVSDFSIEFMVYKNHKTDGSTVTKPGLSDLENTYSKEISEILTDEIHQNTIDKSYRRLLINHREFETFVSRLKADPKLKDGFSITMKVYVPKVCDGITYDNRNLQNIVIYNSAATTSAMPEFFFKNTTTLVELQVDRYNAYVTVGMNPRKH